MNNEITITRLMNEHGNSIIRLCAMYLNDIALAEDAAQETFLRAYRALDKFRGDSAPKTWLTRIAINVCKDMSRRRRRQPIVMETLPESCADDTPSDDSVLREVMALPDKYRAVILLRYYQELSLEETAAALTLTRNAVSQRLHRAKALLRKRIETWYFDDQPTSEVTHDEAVIP